MEDWMSNNWEEIKKKHNEFLNEVQPDLGVRQLATYRLKVQKYLLDEWGGTVSWNRYFADATKESFDMNNSINNCAAKIKSMED
jgi:hypothetical protein